jgi:hypothetical protein
MKPAPPVTSIFCDGDTILIMESETNRERDRERSGMFKEVRKKREIGNLSLSFIVLLDRFVLKSVLMTTHFFSFVNFFFST